VTEIPGWPPATGTWVLDLDGVVWLDGKPIAGADRAVATLRSRGDRVLFATNNSAPTLAELVARLAKVGIAAADEDLVTSAQAAAGLLDPGSRAMTLADPGVTEALEARGVEVVDDGRPVDAVVVGWTHDFDFDRLAKASAAVREGARLIGTNEDGTHPTPEGIQPGGGAILAAVATAAGAAPVVAGKPHDPTVALVRERGGRLVAAVGDRPATDGLLAQRLGVPYALVLSGVTAPGQEVRELVPSVTAADLASLVDAL
jgi:HAD superfamily hydrolase (TIGR01450 family)